MTKPEDIDLSWPAIGLVMAGWRGGSAPYRGWPVLERAHARLKAAQCPRLTEAMAGVHT